MQIVIDIPDVIAERLQKHWSNLTRKVLELLFQAAEQANIVSGAEAEAVLQAHEAEADPEVLAYMERQSSLYQKHQAQLHQTYLGQYVLFEDGNVLDADADFEALVLRTFENEAPRDVFIKQVGSSDELPLVRTPFLSKAV